MHWTRMDPGAHVPKKMDRMRLGADLRSERSVYPIVTGWFLPVPIK